MNRKSHITITRISNYSLALSIAVILSVLMAAAFAHEGFDHVMGTVVKIADNVLTVKTSKGNVEVKLDGKTEITKDNHKAQRADLAPGVRVVVDVPEGSKDKIAHSVKIGTATPADHDAHK
jgi:Co/Zn/Cd efflux system component